MSGIVSPQGQALKSEQLIAEELSKSTGVMKAARNQILYIVDRISQEDFDYKNVIIEKLIGAKLDIEQCIRSVEKKPFFADVDDDSIEPNDEIDFVDDEGYKEMSTIRRIKHLRKKTIGMYITLQSSRPTNQIIAVYGARAINQAEEAVMWMAESLRTL